MDMEKISRSIWFACCQWGNDLCNSDHKWRRYEINQRVT